MSGAFNLVRFGAMLVKESRQILRDPSTLMIAFVLPVILICLFGYGVSLDTARTRIGLALEDHSEAAASLAGAFQSSRFFEVAETADAGTLGTSLVAGHIRGFVVIPQDFARMAQRGGGTIQVVTDGSSPNTAAFVAAYAEGVRQSWLAGRAGRTGAKAGMIAPPISINPRFWFNPELASRFFLVPGAIAIVMTVIGSLLTALVIAREWERGTMEAIMATPLRRFELMVTKVIPYFVLGLGSMTVCSLLAVVVFGVPFRGSPLALLALASAFLVPALGQGLFISSATKNQFVASQIAMMTAFLPSMMLSGFLFEISSMPRWVQMITYVVPSRYLIPPLLSVFLAGDDWEMFGRDIAILLGFGAIFFALAIGATRWRIA
jgi:ABC-2 type transport system permease protein